jgi:hypothetical protein
LPHPPIFKRPGKTIWDFIKKYPWFVTSIIIIIGGINQSYHLYQIGLPFLRFFSVTQLFTDGLILLGYIAIILLVFLFFFHLSSLFLYESIYNHLSYNESQFLKRRDSQKVILTYLVCAVILIIFGSLLFTDFIALAQNLYENPKDLLKISTYTSNGSILMYFLFLIFLLLGLLTVGEKPVLKDGYGALLVWAYYPIFFLSVAHGVRANRPVKLMDISQTTNHKKLVIKLEFENPDYQVKIVYFTDKYIFSKLISKKDTLINISSMNDFIEFKNIK